jgi:ATP phosphoribosyltransferase regulatory subunit
VSYRIPSGTRDILPEEQRELRAIEAALLRTFDEFGYGEVSTPAVEYEETLRVGGLGSLPSYRVLDDHGEPLALRADMTVPIARLVGTRYGSADPPLRFCYFANAYRAVRPHRGQMREFLQAGIELVGAPGAEGTAEALTVLSRAIEATGLSRFHIGLGDAALYPALLEAFEVPAESRERLLHELTSRDFVGLEREVRALGLGDEAARTLIQTPRLRGDAGVLGGAAGPVSDAVEGLREVVARLDEDIAARVIVDLGRAPRLGYYTGPMFEVYDPELGEPIGGGGRYDELLGRFGRSLPAVGFALGVDLLHAALAGEERGS